MTKSCSDLLSQFKNTLNEFMVSARSVTNLDRMPELLNQIKSITDPFEQIIQERINTIGSEFNAQNFDNPTLTQFKTRLKDIQKIPKAEKLPMDIQALITQVKQYEDGYLSPLLTLLSEIEQHYIDIAAHALHEEEQALNFVELNLQTLYAEKEQIENARMIFNRRKKIMALDKEIHIFKSNKKIINLSLRHARLNLYYFNHYQPEELRPYKKKADQSQQEVQFINEVILT
jgi:hypothetical protein